MSPTPWTDEAGVVELADGRRVRGRGLLDPMPAGREPEFGLYLSGTPPPQMSWEARWLRWPDFWLPHDASDAVGAIEEVFARSAVQRVEVACKGGTGRTGSVLACLAILAGTVPEDAVDYVRDHYRPRAVETPWQRRFVERFDK